MDNICNCGKFETYPHRCNCGVNSPQSGMMARALSQPAQKDDYRESMAKAMKLHAVLFKDYCDIYHDRLPLSLKNNELLYDDFLLSLQSALKK